MKKKIFVTVLVAVMALSMLSACGENGGGGNGGGSSDVYESKLYPTPDGVSFKASQKNKAAPDWKEYDSLIEEIQTTTDMTERIAKMHKAEDILIKTGAIIPIYYYNNPSAPSVLSSARKSPRARRRMRTDRGWTH